MSKMWQCSSLVVLVAGGLVVSCTAEL